MNIQPSLEIDPKKPLNVFIKAFIAAHLTISSSVYASENYQHKVLFNPSHQVVQAEARGRVMIYDGLKSETVDLALNEQFDRIQNMMFVRTQYVQENGDYEVEDDGCD